MLKSNKNARNEKEFFDPRWDELTRARVARLRVFQWKKGQSGNPGGRAKLPSELNIIKNQALQRCVEQLATCVNDPVYMASLSADEVAKFFEIVFDRFGLPKVSKTEMSGPDGKPISHQAVDLKEVNLKLLEKLASALNSPK